MSKRLGIVLAGALVLGFGTIGKVTAQETCVGDCNGNMEVTIDEIITCVNIALDLANLDTCPSCDGNGDGEVTIDELITSVNIALDLQPCGGTPSPTPTIMPTGAICGNSKVEDGEDCDDGNNYGGDGCAANCTTETRRAGSLVDSQAVAQSLSITLMLPLTGDQALVTGRARDTEVIGVDGEVITEPGEAPIVVRQEDVDFAPIPLAGLVCACVRGVTEGVEDVFGPGNTGAGNIGCGDDGLTNVDFTIEQDHNTTPGASGNSGSAQGLPDDPECNDTSEVIPGLQSSACLEGTDPACTGPNYVHIGACNSPREITFSGGAAGRGSVLILNSTAIGLLMDRGTCSQTPNCTFADYGPDCLPCTDDDLEKGIPNVQPLTSGDSQVIIYDANNSAGQTFDENASCGANKCITTVSGMNADCDTLSAPGNNSLTGTLAGAFPSLDQMTVNDTITTTILHSE
jgi:cysteine-rich repeat protein